MQTLLVTECVVMIKGCALWWIWLTVCLTFILSYGRAFGYVLQSTNIIMLFCLGKCLTWPSPIKKKDT